MAKKQPAVDVPVTSEPAPVDDGLVEVTLQGLGAGTSPWRVQPDPDGGIPRVISVGGVTYDLHDRAAKVYNYRH